MADEKTASVVNDNLVVEEQSNISETIQENNIFIVQIHNGNN